MGPTPSARPCVTVIIPVRDRDDALRRVLLSIAAQTFRSFEVVIVDDGSVEPVECTLPDPISESVRIVRLDEPAGAASARNAGLRLAHGDLVTFLDSDDEVRPTWLEHLVALCADEQVALACCGIERVDESRRRSRLIQTPRPWLSSRDPVLFLGGAFIVRREVVNAIGGYDDDLAAAQQTDFGLRLLAYLGKSDYRSVWTPAPLVTVNVAGNDRIRRQPCLIAQGARRMISKHLAVFEVHPEEYAAYLTTLAINSFKCTGSSEDLIWPLRQAARLSPRSVKCRLRLLAASVPGFARFLWRARDSNSVSRSALRRSP